MPQYILVAQDGDQISALEKRMKIRPKHLELVRKMNAEGKIVLGGAQLTTVGMMNGSVLIFNFEHENELSEYLKIEPYILEGVWQSYTITPFRVADLS